MEGSDRSTEAAAPLRSGGLTTWRQGGGDTGTGGGDTGGGGIGGGDTGGGHRRGSQAGGTGGVREEAGVHTSWLSHFQGSSVCQVTAIGVTVILLYTSRACYNLFILSFPQSRNVHPFDYDWYNVSDQVSGRGGVERAGRSPLPFGRRGRRRRFLWCPPPRVRCGAVAPAVPARMSREKLGHVCVRTHACTHACTCTHTHTSFCFLPSGGLLSSRT